MNEDDNEWTDCLRQINRAFPGEIFICVYGKDAWGFKSSEFFEPHRYIRYIISTKTWHYQHHGYGTTLEEAIDKENEWHEQARTVATN